MVSFLGIFGPGKLPRRPATEAPKKASFFGGAPVPPSGDVPVSPVEQDACYLNGKAPEPDRWPFDAEKGPDR